MGLLKTMLDKFISECQDYNECVVKGSEELEYQYGLLQGITEGARWCGVDIGYLKLDDGLIHSVSITDHIKSYFIKEII